jgi:Tol biopolymer transport system component
LIGTRLSHFEITATLGEGGMGAVYRAEDTRLGRAVAIKILPEDFDADPEQLARFEREARLLAALNHPNIAALHQVEEHDGRLFLVMELVEGEDLTARLAGGPLPFGEAERLAVQIASGLEAAHARGIVHRDLKPANIKVTPEGEIKILDFGLAKVPRAPEDTGQDLSESPTLTARMTRAGTILGTVGYMSPEQARGEEADERADIWSFGVVLYEMLSGSRLFAERTTTDTLAAVLRAEIDWDRIPDPTPERLRRLLRRCLEREPRHRLHAIADARIELEAPDDPAAPAPSGVAETRPVWKLALAAALAGAAVTVTILLLLGPRPRDAGDPPLRVFGVVDGVGVDFFSTQWGLNVSDPRISPDGSMLVYPSEGRLWIRDLESLAPRPMEGTEGARDAFWSPNSKAIAYVAGPELRRVYARGGASVVLARLDGAYLGGTWGEGDRIVVGLSGRGLMEISARGERQMTVAVDTASGDFDFHSPIFLGDTGRLAFVRHERDGFKNTVEVFDGRERRVAYRAATGSVVTGLAFDAAVSQLILTTIRENAGLWAVQLLLTGDALTSEPRLLAAHGLAPSIAADGLLAYVDGLRIEPAHLVRIDRNGSVKGEVGQPLWDMDRPSTSPDGSRVAIIATHGGARNVWVHDLERATALRVTTAPPENIKVAWSDDGEALVFATRSGETTRLVEQRADGGGGPRVLIEGEIGRPSLPRDGRFVVYQVRGARMRRGPGDIWWFPTGQPDAAAPLVATAADEVQPAVSPDGTLLAYTSDESGAYEVYLRPVTGEGQRLRVSARGGEAPLWSRDGRELYFVEDSTLVGVLVGDGGQSLGPPQRLFSGSEVSSPLVQNGISALTLGPEGDFLVVQQRVPGSPRVVAVENWTRLLRD